MIGRSNSALSLSAQCWVLNLNRASLFYRAEGENPETLVLMRRFDELFMVYSFYGSRQIARHLVREGTRAGRHRVRRLIRKMGLQAIYQAPRTSQPHPEHKIYPYLLRDLAITRVDQVWYADITYSAPRLGRTGVRVFWNALRKEGMKECLAPAVRSMSRSGGDLLSTGRVT